MKRALVALMTATMLTGLLGGVNVRAEDGSTFDFMSIYSETNEAGEIPITEFYKKYNAWKEEHPDVTIEKEDLAETDYQTKIMALAAADDLPDMFFVKGSWMSTFQDNGSMLPLNDIIDNYEHKDAFNASAFVGSTGSDGNIYGIPTTMQCTSLVFYNADLWKQAGYDSFPDNWEDVRKASEYFRENGIVPFAFGNKPLWPSESCWLSCVGDRFTGTEWTDGIIALDPNYKFTDENFVKAVQFMADNADLFNADYNSIDNTTADQQYYCTGQAATVVEGEWVLSTILDSGTEDVISNTHLAVLPSLGGEGNPNTSSGGCGWFVCLNSNLKDSDKLDTLADLLLTITGYDFAKALLENGFYGSCNVEDVDTSNISSLSEEYLTLMEKLDALTPTYDIRMEASVIEIMNTGMQEVLNGTKTAEDLCAEIQAAQEACY